MLSLTAMIFKLLHTLMLISIILLKILCSWDLSLSKHFLEPNSKFELVSNMSTEILDSYEDLVSRLVRNKVDNIEIIAHGRCFDLEVSSYDDFTSRRILLLRRVILEICKISDSSTGNYSNLLVKVNQLLKEKRLSFLY